MVVNVYCSGVVVAARSKTSMRSAGVNGTGPVTLGTGGISITGAISRTGTGTGAVTISGAIGSGVTTLTAIFVPPISIARTERSATADEGSFHRRRA